MQDIPQQQAAYIAACTVYITAKINNLYEYKYQNIYQDEFTDHVAHFKPILEVIPK